MYYGTIKKCDTANGPGVRVSLFVSGCRNHCEGCFQPETWDFKYGQEFTEETKKNIIKLLKPDYISGFSLLGGEPFEPENQKILTPLLKEIKTKYPKKTIWCYTGYTLNNNIKMPEKIETDNTDEMLSYIDTLIDGRFEIDLKDISLAYRGSRNQRIIDIQESRNRHEIIQKQL